MKTLFVVHVQQLKTDLENAIRNRLGGIPKTLLISHTRKGA